MTKDKNKLGNVTVICKNLENQFQLTHLGTQIAIKSDGYLKDK